jgi:NAD(P)-dependent dehydrogenase (short-subunit alcohol dehydrogenase family)
LPQPDDVSASSSAPDRGDAATDDRPADDESTQQETASMSRQLQDRVAIVTGASNGIGRAIAEAFAGEGAKTVLAARRAGLLDEVASGIRSRGGEALAVPTDLTQEAQITALFTKLIAAYGRLDILVNNAGVPTHINTEEISLAYWREVLDINITAAFLCCREAIRIMKRQTPQGGRIINVGSVSAKTPRPDSLPYTTTKFAIQGMTHQLTMDGRKYGVVASIIHPGATLSSFSTRRGRTKAGPGATPDDYIMAAEDVAKVAVLMSTLPPEVNLYEATILPNHMRSFIGRG